MDSSQTWVEKLKNKIIRREIMPYENGAHGVLEMLKEFVASTVKLLVNNKDAVKVNVTVSTKALIFQVDVDQPDCGKVIGKSGRTIEAIKLLLLSIKNTYFIDDKRKIFLEVVEDIDSTFLKDSFGG